MDDHIRVISLPYQPIAAIDLIVVLVYRLAVFLVGGDSHGEYQIVAVGIAV